MGQTFNLGNELTISNYRIFYSKLVPYKGKRNIILSKLAEFLTRFQPYINDLKDDRYFYDRDFNRFITEIEGFLEETFNQEISSGFSKPKIFEKQINQPVVGNDLVKEILGVLIENRRTHPSEKVNISIARFDYLTKVHNCLMDFGLHNEINYRDKNKFKRYNIIIEHRHNRNKLAREFIQLISYNKLNEEYLKVHKSGQPFLINGLKIPSESVHRLIITSTILKDEEIQNFKEKIGARTILEFVSSCFDETNILLENHSISNSIELNDDIWNLVHPKINILVKPLFFSSQFNEAVRTAFIELNDIIKQDYLTISGEELDGDKLMRKVFSVNDPVFQLGDSTQSGKDVQQGYMELFAGSIRAIRNPKAHKNLKIDPIEALEKIIFASHLLKVYESRKN